MQILIYLMLNYGVELLVWKKIRRFFVGLLLTVKRKVFVASVTRQINLFEGKPRVTFYGLKVSVLV